MYYIDYTDSFVLQENHVLDSCVTLWFTTGGSYQHRQVY